MRTPSFPAAMSGTIDIVGAAAPDLSLPRDKLPGRLLVDSDNDRVGKNFLGALDASVRCIVALETVNTTHNEIAQTITPSLNIIPPGPRG